MIKKKISELPECTSFKGLWTIGVDIFNKSVKVSLEYIQSVVEGMKAATKDATDVTDAASKSAQSAINAAQKHKKLRPPPIPQPRTPAMPPPPRLRRKRIARR